LEIAVEKYKWPATAVLCTTLQLNIPILWYGYDFVSGNERLANDVARWTKEIGGGGWQSYKVVRSLSDFLKTLNIFLEMHTAYKSLRSIKLNTPLYSACTYVLVLSNLTLLDSSICMWLLNTDFTLMKIYYYAQFELGSVKA